MPNQDNKTLNINPSIVYKHLKADFIINNIPLEGMKMTKLISLLIAGTTVIILKEKGYCDRGTLSNISVRLRLPL